MSKNNVKQRQLQKASLATLTLALGLLTATGSAGPLNLSDNALEIVIGVEPNIVILNDDSGSMSWSLMTREASGVAWLTDGVTNNWSYYYVHPAPGSSGSEPATNSYIYVLATEEQVIADGITTAPYSGIWRYRNTDYNKIYYNPNVTYIPWAGVNSVGATFTNANPAAALYDPYYPANGSLNLTTSMSYWTDYCDPNYCGSVNVSSFYPARYQTWSDTNTTTPANADNGVVDDDDDHNLVKIISTTSNYPGRLAYNDTTSTGRSDCTDVGGGMATCTYAQEIQNFANWFSYYRKRDLTAKAAFSNAIKPADSARIGYATINNKISGSVGDNLRVASMNISPASGNKRALLDKLFATSPSGSTPLREALRDTGRYFDCASNDIFGSSSNSSPGSSDCPVEDTPVGQCQQNYTILMTDGFWNGSSPNIVASGGNSNPQNNVDDDGGDFAGGAFSDIYNDTLADIAMHYYKTDLHASLSDNVPATTRDIVHYLGNTDPFENMHQHMNTYTVGFGVNGTLNANPPGPTNPFLWTDPYSDNTVTDPVTNITTIISTSDEHKIDDLRHAAYNGRGEFLNAANPVELVNAMDDIFNDIASSTGTATAVAFNTQEVESGT
ncbi:hypothetical protein JYT26_02500, partial [Beggiatoa alba]|nr:hypothetical protein [Beggiatoa alba]